MLHCSNSVYFQITKTQIPLFTHSAHPRSVTFLTQVFALSRNEASDENNDRCHQVEEVSCGVEDFPPAYDCAINVISSFCFCAQRLFSGYLSVTKFLRRKLRVPFLPWLNNTTHDSPFTWSNVEDPTYSTHSQDSTFLSGYAQLSG